jgi:hypothetical protein
MLMGANAALLTPDGKSAADLARDRGHICPLKLIQSDVSELAAVKHAIISDGCPGQYLNWYFYYSSYIFVMANRQAVARDA